MNRSTRPSKSTTCSVLLNKINSFSNFCPHFLQSKMRTACFHLHTFKDPKIFWINPKYPDQFFGTDHGDARGGIQLLTYNPINFQKKILDGLRISAVRRGSRSARKLPENLDAPKKFCKTFSAVYRGFRSARKLPETPDRLKKTPLSSKRGLNDS